MINHKTLLTLAVLVIVVIAAAIWTQREPISETKQGGTLFPELMGQINSANKLKGKTNQDTFTVVREDNQWVVQEKSGYPADSEKLRKFIIGLAELKRLEPKTSNPELYQKLDLQDVDEAGAKSLQVTVEGENGDALVNLIVGKEASSAGSTESKYWYVRIPNEKQAWLVQGSLPIDKQANEWLDREILQLTRDRVHEVRVQHADGETVVIRRENGDETDYILVDQPEGTVVDSQWGINTIATTFAELTLEDVAPVSVIEKESDSEFVAEIKAFDGLQVELEATKVADQMYVVLHASVSSAIPNRLSEVDQSDGAGGESASPTGAEDDNMSIRQEAESLNARWQGWAYIIPEYAVSNLAVRKEELIKANEQAVSE
ncbi:MAG: DUF4340 domain-containing protein [Gammaproteobacteria bacterium]|nr:DUF4340 domain-containing protein [Gammaproteobacteria bacterium]